MRGKFKYIAVIAAPSRETRLVRAPRSMLDLLVDKDIQAVHFQREAGRRWTKTTDWPTYTYDSWALPGPVNRMQVSLKTNEGIQNSSHILGCLNDFRLEIKRRMDTFRGIVTHSN